MVSATPFTKFLHWKFILLQFLLQGFAAGSKCSVPGSLSFEGKIIGQQQINISTIPKVCSYSLKTNRTSRVQLFLETSNLSPKTNKLVLFNGPDCLSPKSFLVQGTSSKYVSVRNDFSLLHIFTGKSDSLFSAEFNSVAATDVVPSIPQTLDEVVMFALAYCGGELQNASGILTSRSTEEFIIPNEQLCIWRLVSPPRNIIKLLIEEINMNNKGTHLFWVMDGPNCGSPTLFSSSAPSSEFPKTVLSTGQFMTVVYYGRIVKGDQPFEAQYTIISE